MDPNQHEEGGLSHQAFGEEELELGASCLSLASLSLTKKGMVKKKNNPILSKISEVDTSGI